MTSFPSLTHARTHARRQAKHAGGPLYAVDQLIRDYLGFDLSPKKKDPPNVCAADLALMVHRSP